MRGLLLIGLLTLGVASMVALSGAQAADCDNAQNQRTMNECADKDYRKSDAEFEQTLQTDRAPVEG